ncbi:hypothetical protein BC834DRAFT_888136 [Gloeopeniophorella convolvens]|nr:hypothetical protein BC834DRAFT_888136 [Gloeopeniophorella convolvens]
MHASGGCSRQLRSGIYPGMCIIGLKTRTSTDPRAPSLAAGPGLGHDFMANVRLRW